MQDTTTDITQQGYVRFENASDGIATISFFHPNHNSLPSRLLQGLVDAFEAAGKDNTVKVIVLQSTEHRTFCAGASFDELVEINDLETGKRFFSGFGNVINAMRRCPKVIVGRVQGKAVGGGVGLLAATDICMATQYASVRLSELAVGFGPFVIGPAVERKVGIPAFIQLALNPSEWQTAAWAKEKGLFQEVFVSVEQLDAYIAHFTGNLSGYSSEALSELKKTFWRGTENWETLLAERAAISGRLALSEFTKKAIEAFKSKS
ncbi:MAG: enoyl-CoA hydratase/isomerase family protein [Bacteroidetes bacterium]|nr:MAG: enoyl-CoA hydratase/isomerase family protein [Bacteroidota bacterium]